MQETGTRALQAAALGTLAAALALPLAVLGALNIVVGNKWTKALSRAKVKGGEMSGRVIGGRGCNEWQGDRWEGGV